MRFSTLVMLPFAFLAPSWWMNRGNDEEIGSVA